MKKEKPDIKKQEIYQEFIVKRGGKVEVPWIIPKATPFVTAVVKQLSKENQMPASVECGKYIYCG